MGEKRGLLGAGKKSFVEFNINEITADLIDKNNSPKRNIVAENENTEETQRHEESIIRVAYKIKNNRKLNDIDRSKAMASFELVCQHNIELLEEADGLAAQEKAATETTQQANGNSTNNEITLELIPKWWIGTSESAF